MSFSISKMALVAAALSAPVIAAETGKSTRYWDCCKPSCAWTGKADVSSPVGTCDAKNNPLSDPNATSGCNGGTSYTCGSYSPWAVNDDLAYGFAATALGGQSESDWCCACYKVTFTSGPVSGKTMIVQSTNTGGDLGNNHFDLLIPGGGVGIFDGCASQFGGLPGAQYGGISSVSDCESFPSYLKDGCKWRFDWFQNADNPDLTFERVQCPAAITDVSGCVRSDDANYAAAGTNNSESPSSAASSAASKAASSVAATSSSSTTSKAAESQPASSTTSKAADSQQTSSAASNGGSQSSAEEAKPASSQASSATTADAAKETIKPPKTCKSKRHLHNHRRHF